MKTFAERLKEAMNTRGFKQIDILRRAEPFCEEYGIKLGKSHLSQYLSGKTEPRKDVFAVLAKVLNVNVMWLQGEDVAMETELSIKDSNTNGKDVIKMDINQTASSKSTIRHFSKSSKLNNVLYDVRGPVVEEANRMEASGMHILKLNIGNPAPFDFHAPDEVWYDMQRQLTDCEGYSDSKGLFSARKAIMQYAQLKNIPNVT